VIKTELLRDHMDDQRLFAWRKLIHPLCPKRNREPEQEHSLDQDDGEFQMRRDAAPHTAVIRPWLAASPEPNQHENKKRRPTKEERTHEPVAELEDVIDLISMRGGVGRLAQAFIDERKATHTCSDLPRSIPGRARSACAHAATGEN